MPPTASFHRSHSASCCHVDTPFLVLPAPLRSQPFSGSALTRIVPPAAQLLISTEPQEGPAASYRQGAETAGGLEIMVTNYPHQVAAHQGLQTTTSSVPNGGFARAMEMVSQLFCGLR